MSPFGKQSIYILLITAACFLIYQFAFQVHLGGPATGHVKQENSAAVKNSDAGFLGKNDNLKIENEPIPDYVFEVLHYILKEQKAPPGFVGGRIFQNREKLLNLFDSSHNKIIYKEWDVHQKVAGKNRGAERLVTGSDHSAYYTKDHYKTFIQIYP